MCVWWEVYRDQEKGAVACGSQERESDPGELELTNLRVLCKSNTLNHRVISLVPKKMGFLFCFAECLFCFFEVLGDKLRAFVR